MKTTLKFLFSAIFFLMLNLYCTAQDAMVQLDIDQVESNTKEINIEKEKSTLSPKQIYLNETQMATEQMIQHLAEKITYPEHLKEQYLEGEVIVEVLINKKGTIQEAKVYQSLQKDFDQLVLASILEMTKINVNRMKYEGARRLRIPVNFSLR